MLINIENFNSNIYFDSFVLYSKELMKKVMPALKKILEETGEDRTWFMDLRKKLVAQFKSKDF